MRGRYLEVTFRKGRAIAAYLYLPRRGTERAARVSKASAGLLIDYDPQGKPIGIEITAPGRSEEHTSELQSQSNLVCRLLLEKKKKDNPAEQTPMQGQSTT